MNSLARAVAAARHLGAILGPPGLIIGLVSILCLAFGLALLWQEYDGLRRTGDQAVRNLVADWAKTSAVDDVGRTLRDYAARWKSAEQGAERDDRARSLRAALQNLGNGGARPSTDRFGLLRISSLELVAPGEPLVGSWRSAVAPPPAEAESMDVFPILETESPKTLWPAGKQAPRLALRVTYHVNGGVERVLGDLQRSYRRLLLAVAGLSGYSLLCLGYMVSQARGLQERAARESAQQATIDLADRTCHELGNVTFVLANERRNLADHLELVERFLRELPEAIGAAGARAGLDGPAATRLARGIDRELADRGLDPRAELTTATLLARQVCRQIEVCSAYVTLTVRELDAYLKQADQPVHPEPIPLATCIDDSLALLAPRLDSAGAIVTRPPPADEATLAQADRRLLVHALVNLLKNAVEATTAAGIAPRIALGISEDTAGQLVTLSVADNGPGIASAEADRVFRAGYSTKGAGRGRGLAIARESIRAQGGAIRLISAPGQGATFHISLPAPPRARPSGEGHLQPLHEDRRLAREPLADIDGRPAVSGRAIGQQGA